MRVDTILENPSRFIGNKVEIEGTLVEEVFRSRNSNYYVADPTSGTNFSLEKAILIADEGETLHLKKLYDERLRERSSRLLEEYVASDDMLKHRKALKETGNYEHLEFLIQAQADEYVARSLPYGRISLNPARFIIQLTFGLASPMTPLEGDLELYPHPYAVTIWGILEPSADSASGFALTACEEAILRRKTYHLYISTREFLLHKIDLGISQVEAASDVLQSPKKFIGKEFRVSGVVYGSASRYPLQHFCLVPNAAYLELKAPEEHAILIGSEDLIENITMRLSGSRIRGDKKFAYVLPCHLVCSISETDKKPYRAEITNVFSSAIDTGFGIYHFTDYRKT
jgi:hypothetical protein